MADRILCLDFKNRVRVYCISDFFYKYRIISSYKISITYFENLVFNEMRKSSVFLIKSSGCTVNVAD